MKHAVSQNNLFFFQMHFCRLATRYFLTVKIYSLRHVIELLFKVQLGPDHPTSNTD